MGFNSSKIRKNKEVVELEDAFLRHYHISIEQEGSIDRRIHMTEEIQIFSNRLFGILYDNLTKQEKQFINLLRNYILLQEDKLKTEESTKLIEGSIQSAAEDIIENALFATLMMPETFFYKENIVNIFQPEDLATYLDFFQQSIYTNECNKLDEEAVIDHREEKSEPHPIVNIIESIYHTSEMKKGDFKKTLKKRIADLARYFKNTPGIFAYAFARSELLNKHDLHSIMRIHFEKDYLYIKENGFIDDRF